MPAPQLALTNITLAGLIEIKLNNKEAIYYLEKAILGGTEPGL